VREGDLSAFLSFLPPCGGEAPDVLPGGGSAQSAQARDAVAVPALSRRGRGTLRAGLALPGPWLRVARGGIGTEHPPRISRPKPCARRPASRRSPKGRPVPVADEARSSRAPPHIPGATRLDCQFRSCDRRSEHRGRPFEAPTPGAASDRSSRGRDRSSAVDCRPSPTPNPALVEVAARWSRDPARGARGGAFCRRQGRSGNRSPGAAGARTGEGDRLFDLDRSPGAMDLGASSSRRGIPFVGGCAPGRLPHPEAGAPGRCLQPEARDVPFPFPDGPLRPFARFRAVRRLRSRLPARVHCEDSRAPKRRDRSEPFRDAERPVAFRRGGSSAQPQCGRGRGPGSSHAAGPLRGGRAAGTAPGSPVAPARADRSGVQRFPGRFSAPDRGGFRSDQERIAEALSSSLLPRGAAHGRP
jgi:hypothetical protein